MNRRAGGAVALGALLAAWAGPAAGQTLALNLQDGSPPGVAVSVRDLLEGRGFLDALHSGFPLYMEYRVLLRRPQAIRDRTVWNEVWELVVVYDPVREQYTVRTPDSAEVVGTRAALARRLAQVTVIRLDVPAGEFYYEAAVDARMLSDDDVDEAFAWLRGDHAEGAALKDPGMLARIARRFLMKVTALPRVQLDARTGRFVVP